MASSRCMACVAAPMSSKPERRAGTGDGAGGAAPSSAAAASAARRFTPPAAARRSTCAKPLSPCHSNSSVPLSVASSVEGEVGIGGDGRMQFGAEHRLAVVAAGEAPQDVARQHAAVGAGAVAGLHHVRDGGAHLDHLAARPWRHLDQRAGHVGLPSMQAASTTMTSTVSDHTLPSFMRASADSFWLVASRMRVATSALPARGPSVKTATSRCGFFSLKTAISVHVVGRGHRAVDATRIGHHVAVVDQLRDLQLDAAGRTAGPGELPRPPRPSACRASCALGRRDAPAPARPRAPAQQRRRQQEGRGGGRLHACKPSARWPAMRPRPRPAARRGWACLPRRAHARGLLALWKAGMKLAGLSAAHPPRAGAIALRCSARPAPARSGARLPWKRSSGIGRRVAQQAQALLPAGDDGAAALRVAAQAASGCGCRRPHAYGATSCAPATALPPPAATARQRAWRQPRAQAPSGCGSSAAGRGCACRSPRRSRSAPPAPPPRWSARRRRPRSRRGHQHGLHLRHVPHLHHRVGAEVVLLDAAVLQRALAEQRRRQAVGERAFDLRLDLLRVDRVAGIGGGDDAVDLQLALPCRPTPRRRRPRSCRSPWSAPGRGTPSARRRRAPACPSRRARPPRSARPGAWDGWPSACGAAPAGPAWWHARSRR
jgi:hypothetical protein